MTIDAILLMAVSMLVLWGGLGAAIDHQLFDPQRFAAHRGRILDIPGSDHRGVLVEYIVDAARVP